MMTIEKIKKILKNREPSTVGKHRFYSVLVPIVEVDGDLHLLYEVRSQKIKRQPGEICFPGGAIEPGEDPKTAAIRETYEEIGIPKDKIEIISEGDKLVTTNNFTLYSYFGYLEKNSMDDLKLNPDEVGEVFTVPVEWLQDNPPDVHIVDVSQKNREDFPFEKAHIPEDYPWRGTYSEVPIYNYKDKAIWGLTGRITRNFIQILNGEKK